MFFVGAFVLAFLANAIHLCSVWLLMLLLPCSCFACCRRSFQNSICARGSNPQMTVDSEELTLILKGSLLSAAKSKGITVW